VIWLLEVTILLAQWLAVFSFFFSASQGQERASKGKRITAPGTRNKRPEAGREHPISFLAIWRECTKGKGKVNRWVPTGNREPADLSYLSFFQPVKRKEDYCSRHKE
jgi:hypothetical protein